MVVCQSDPNLVKGVVPSSSSSSSSSYDNAERYCDTVCKENIDGMTINSSFSELTREGNNDAVGNFENISVCNSTDIHFGNKTFYNGPVTIKKFIYSAEGNSPDCLASHDNQETVNFDQEFKKFSELEIQNISCARTCMPYVTNDLKITNVDQKQSNSACTSEENSKFGKVLHKGYLKCCGLPVRYILLATGVVLVTVLLIVLTVLVLRSEMKVSERAHEETVMGQPSGGNFTLSGKLRIMQRKEWLAQPRAAPLDKLRTPVPYVIISHTATEQCLLISECILQVRIVQTFHLESRGWWDIGYNFLVGGDGFAYVGRGWDFVGAHSFGFNNVSIGISFIGTFNNVLPPERQLKAAKQLIEMGVQIGKISENYKLLAHKQVSGTESPGAVLFEELKKWPHWAHSP